MPEWSSCNTRVFFVRHISAFLPLARTLDSLMLGGHFKQWHHQHKAHNVKNVALWKEYLFTEWEMKQDGRAWPYSTSAGNVGWLKLFTSLRMSTNSHEYGEHWFEATAELQGVGKFTNTESANPDRWLYHQKQIDETVELLLISK